MKRFKKTTVVIMGAFAAAAVYWAVNAAFGCPVRALTGIPCPACGLTRASLSFIKGDIAIAFAYHPLFPLAWALPVLLALYLILHAKNKLAKRGELAFVFIFCVIGLAFAAVYILRMLNGSINRI